MFVEGGDRKEACSTGFAAVTTGEKAGSVFRSYVSRAVAQGVSHRQIHQRRKGFWENATERSSGENRMNGRYCRHVAGGP
jgi:hypothetical protein